MKIRAELTGMVPFPSTYPFPLGCHLGAKNIETFIYLFICIQSGIRSCYGTEMVFVAEMSWKMDWGSITLLIFLDLSGLPLGVGPRRHCSAVVLVLPQR